MPSKTTLYRGSLVVVVLLAIVAGPMAAVASAHTASTVPDTGEVSAPTPVSNDPVVDSTRRGTTDEIDDGIPGDVAGTADRIEPVHARDPDGDVHDDGTVPRLELDPMALDTDGDGLSDGAELRHGTDPTRADTDGDGLSDRLETRQATDPLAIDSDGDGIDDSTEMKGTTNPTAADTDGDGLSDGDEIVRGADPTRPDTDGDGLTDGAEVNSAGTDPLTADSDGDFLKDVNELKWGYDPTDWMSPITIPGIVGGFLLGALLSGGIAIHWSRIRKHLEALPLVGGPIRELFAEGRDTDSDVRADATSPVVEETESRTPDDDEIVPDDVYVHRILGEKNGRARQSNIVEMTEWSKSKVSRVLSRMAEDGQVIKIMLGRENLVCLPGHEPEIAKSSFG